MKTLTKLVTSRNFAACLVLAALFAFTAAVYSIFWHSPDDYLQGNLVKIMYVHVPCAWLSILLYAISAAFSVIYLVNKLYIFDVVAKNALYLATCFIGATLITGSIWGQPAWGTWWIWDARLTSMLILFFIALSSIFVRNMHSEILLASHLSSVVTIVGFINIPIIKFSVEIWSTLHQKSSFFKLEGSSVHPSMMYPTIVMFLAAFLLSVAFILSKTSLEIARNKLKRIFN